MRSSTLARWRRLGIRSGGLTRPEPRPIPSIRRLAAKYDLLFPHASEEQRYQDTGRRSSSARPSRTSTSIYDVVQCYSTDGLAPLANQHKSFCSYEHGTIARSRGTTTCRAAVRLTYTHAPYVFVTNTDNIAAIDKLKVPRDRAIWLPHAFNDRKLRDFEPAIRQSARSRRAAPYLLSGAPALEGCRRAAGRRGTTSSSGGGRRKGAGSQVPAAARRWGHDLEISKALCDELGLSEVIEWVPPMKKEALWKTYIESDAIADQFFTPALGGVGFEALCLGKRLITALDVPTSAEFFGVAPPLFACSTPEEAMQAVAAVATDVDDARGMGRSAAQWVLDYHSAPRVVRLQVEVYQKLIAANGPAAFRT